jgi:hypothetical protein
MTTRGFQPILSRGQSGNARRSALKDATCRMWRSLRGVPLEIQNIVYGLTRSEPRNSRGHLLGQWPRVARVCASHGAPLVDVMAPAYEVELELKREIYGRTLPPLLEVEAMEADVVCRIQKAEIAGDIRTLKDVAREERVIAELLEEVADQQLDVKSA